MRTQKLLDALKENAYVHVQKLETLLDLKERSIRTLIKDLKTVGCDHGFEIVTIPNKGYKLVITDIDKYTAYYETLDTEFVGSRQLRIPKILYYLIQQDGYTPIQDIADWLEVTRKTITLDLAHIQPYIDSLNLTLETKAHYGVRIAGEEKDLRHGFTRYVVNSNEYTSMTLVYFDFLHTINQDLLRQEIGKRFEKSHITIADVAMDSIIDHIKILLYRIKDNNFIQSLKLGKREINSVYVEIADEIVDWIEREYQVELPQSERDYLASQIAGRTSMDVMPIDDETTLRSKIHSILIKLDDEFVTEFSSDDMLEQALLMHMYPLLTRISHRIQLNNPLVDFVSSRYANVFLIALRFVELYNDIDEIELSKDEMGYVALHFASHIERKKSLIIDSYRNVLIVSEIGRGNVLLLKHKLASVFPASNISVSSSRSLSGVSLQSVDLILSTIDPSNLEVDVDVPIIAIDEMIDDAYLKDLKEILIAKTTIDSTIDDRNLIGKLIHPSFFKIVDSGDYLETITAMSESMVDHGFADPTFPDYVLKRERKFSTIYGGGVAGPHGLVLNAIKECVGIIISKQEMVYQDKPVRIIFLINIFKGNLFLYREISRFILHVLNNPEISKQLIAVDTYESFETLLKSIKY